MKYKRQSDLQTMCLNVIAENMHLYRQPDESLELQIEFLRRVYTDRLFSVFESKSLHHERYIEWFLSPHWKDVYLYLSPHTIPGVVKKLQTVGHVITSLNLKDSPVSADIISAIVCCVPNVTDLILRRTYCTDTVLTLIRKMCPSLEYLDLSQCKKISDVGVTNLCNLNKDDIGFDSLQALSLYGTSVTNDGVLLVLKHLTNLEELGYLGLFVILYDLHKSDFESNLKRYNLTHFVFGPIGPNLRPTCIFRVLQIWAVMCPYITRINIQAFSPTRALGVCTSFKYLEEIKIDSMYLSDRNTYVSPFIEEKGNMLTELRLEHVIVSMEVITQLCHKLEHIYLDGIGYEDFNPSALDSEMHKLKKLKSIIVKNVNFEGEVAFRSVQLLIHASRNVEYLCVGYSKHFPDSLADIILSLPYLTDVDFCFTDIKPLTLVRFFSSENIGKISTDGCPCISEKDKEFPITKFINNSRYGNTCSWEVDYSESNDR